MYSTVHWFSTHALFLRNRGVAWLLCLSACAPPHTGANFPTTMSTTSEAGILSDLPLSVIPAEQYDPALPIIVYLSGDGGWNTFAQGFCQELARNNMPVVGLDALSYFRNKKSPQQVADDLTRIIQYYQSEWHHSSVLLVGFSFGASVLPFAYNHLPNDIKDRVTAVMILSPSAHADFRIHLRNLLAMDGSKKYPMLPEIEKMHSVPVFCLYGEEENSAWLPKALPPTMSLTILPGGHHYDHNYSRLVQTVIQHQSS